MTHTGQIGPHMLALKAGYAAKEGTYRRADLQLFPLMKDENGDGPCIAVLKNCYFAKERYCIAADDGWRAICHLNPWINGTLPSPWQQNPFYAFAEGLFGLRSK